jgi:hypothetical protein
MIFPPIHNRQLVKVVNKLPMLLNAGGEQREMTQSRDGSAKIYFRTTLRIFVRHREEEKPKSYGFIFLLTYSVYSKKLRQIQGHAAPPNLTASL